MDFQLLDYILIYFIAILMFVLVDGLWLGKIAPKIYRKYIGHLMAKKPNLPVAGIFYATYIIGVMIFVLIPALNAESISHALGYGALYGLFTYATFDLTSHAVFKKWPAEITIVDMCWGTILGTLVSGLSYVIAHALLAG